MTNPNVINTSTSEEGLLGANTITNATKVEAVNALEPLFMAIIRDERLDAMFGTGNDVVTKEQYAKSVLALANGEWEKQDYKNICVNQRTVRDSQRVDDQQRGEYGLDELVINGKLDLNTFFAYVGRLAEEYKRKEQPTGTNKTE